MYNWRGWLGLDDNKLQRGTGYGGEEENIRFDSFVGLE